MLHATSQILYQKMSDRFTTFEENIAKETDNLEDLKFVFNNVAEICSMVQDAELEMLDIGERYRTLMRYSISSVQEEELSAAIALPERW